MRNNLFNQMLLRKYADKFKPTHKQKLTILEYVEKVENGDFEGEERNYINFFDMILKDVLGYTRDDVDSHSRVDDGPGRVEFALQSGKDRFMVVELKGQNVDLDKKQTRQSDTKTPIDQAFGLLLFIWERWNGSFSLTMMSLGSIIIMRRQSIYHLMHVILEMKIC